MNGFCDNVDDGDYDDDDDCNYHVSFLLFLTAN